MLDVVSDGRFDLGVGSGPMAGECSVFGIDGKTAAIRTFEALEIIERCWAGEPFVHSGEHFRFSEVANMPRPVQPGGPRIYMAPTGPKSAAQTVERGYQFCLALGPSSGRSVRALRARTGRDASPAQLRLCGYAVRGWHTGPGRRAVAGPLRTRAGRRTHHPVPSWRHAQPRRPQINATVRRAATGHRSLGSSEVARTNNRHLSVDSATKCRLL